MADVYQLMEGATSVGYTIETTVGTDPATTRIRMPGPVLNIPNLSENRNFQDFQPLGEGPDPHFILEQSDEFEIEFEMMLSEDFDSSLGGGDDEYVSLALGTIDGPAGGNTGVITNCRPLRSATYEYGWTNLKQQQVVTMDILTAVDSVTYTVTVDGFDFEFTATVPTDTESDIRDALVVLINDYARLPISGVAGGPFTVGETVTDGADSAVVLHQHTDFLLVAQDPTNPIANAASITGGGSGATATVGTVSTPVTAAAGLVDTFTLTSTVAGEPFSASFSSSGASATTDLAIDSRANMSWYVRLEGSKTSQLSWAFRPDEHVLMTGSHWPLSFTLLERPTLMTVGDGLLDLVVSTAVPAHHKDITYTFLDVPGGNTLNAIVTSFDLTIENNLERKFSNNGSFGASHIVETKRRVSWNMTTLKQDNDFWFIQTLQPGTNGGKVDLQIVVDQPNSSGWFMDIDMPLCVLSEHENALGQDVAVNEETFAGMLVGPPTIDMRR